MATDDNFMEYDESLEEAPPQIWPAFGLPLIENLPDPFPLDKLTNNDFKVIVQRLVGEAIRCNQIADAAELIRRLRLIDSLRSADQQVYNFYKTLIALLRFVSFISRKQKDARNLLAENTINALKAKIGVVNNVKDYLELYEDETGPNRQMRRELTYALEYNKEQLGSQSLSLEDEGRVSPTLQNWIKDYNVSQHLTSARGKFNQINYLNTSSNARQLAKEDKKILEQVLNIYDWLLFPPLNTQINPTELQTAESALGVTYLTSDKFVLPKEAFELEPESSVEETPASPSAIPPKVPQPLGQGAATKVRMEDIMGDRGTSSQQSAVSSQGGDKISNFQFPISNGDIADSSKQLADRETTSPTPPRRDTLSSPGEGEKGRLSGIAVMPPLGAVQGKVLAPPLVTAETLAAQMERKKQELGSRNKELGTGDNLSVPPKAGHLPSSGENNNGGFASKAESFVQKEIDQKLHNLEEKLKNKDRQ